MRRYTVSVTTAADGTATAFSPRLRGKIMQIEYVKANFTDGVDFTITGEATGINILTEANVNASAVRAPRLPTHTPAGAAALYAAGGTAVLAPIALAGPDRVRIAIAQGGNATTGVFHILVD